MTPRGKNAADRDTKLIDLDDEVDRAEKDLLVRNKMGLHARPAALIVQTANRYPCDVALVKDGQEVNGKSIMGVLMLAAAKGSTITVRTVRRICRLRSAVSRM